MADAWSLRPAGPADAGFLYDVYASTRRDEVAATGWRMAETEAFLQSQFALQDRFYHEHFPQAHYDVVQAWGAQVGRLYVDRSLHEIRVLDIALLPPYRRRGLGRALLGSLLNEAAGSGRRVGLHVERHNPALGLYRALGFVVTDDQQGIYLEMHWQQDSTIPPRLWHCQPSQQRAP